MGTLIFTDAMPMHPLPWMLEVRSMDTWMPDAIHWVQPARLKDGGMEAGIFALPLEDQPPWYIHQSLVTAWMFGALWRNCYQIETMSLLEKRRILQLLLDFRRDFPEEIREVWPTAWEPYGYDPTGIRGDVCRHDFSRYPEWVQALFDERLVKPLIPWRIP